MSDLQTILIVDDEPNNLDLLFAVLSAHQYNILIAEGGETALSRAQQGKPDLILLDVVMPDIDGFTVCRRLKAMEQTAHIPIIFLTAVTDPALIVKAFQLGAVDYIPKPFQQTEILARVQNHLTIHATQTELSRRVRQRTAELEAANAQLEQRVADRSRELAALYDMTMLFTEARSLTDILDPALRNINNTVGGSAIVAHILTDDGDQLQLASHISLIAWKQMRQMALTAVYADWLQQADAPLMLVGYKNKHEFVPSALLPADYQTYLGVALRVRGEVIGTLSVYCEEKRPFSVKEVSLLITMAEQLGIIIQNYRLQEQSRRMTRAMERRTLARKLHDSIAQRIYSLSLFARAGQDALADGDVEDAHLRLQQVGENARYTLREMRLLLYQLRPLALENQTLIAAFEERFALVERRLGIEAVVQATTTPELTEAIEEELYYIITEALNNGLKHAQATQESLCFDSANGTLSVTIRDNGQGFDLEQPSSGLGLGNMRERTAQIKGTLRIKTAVGKGTTIYITL